MFPHPGLSLKGIFCAKTSSYLAVQMHGCDATSGGSSPFRLKHSCIWVFPGHKKMLNCYQYNQSKSTNDHILSTILTLQNYPRVTWTPRNSSRPLLDSALPRSEACVSGLSAGRGRKNTRQKGGKGGKQFHSTSCFSASASITAVTTLQQAHLLTINKP